VRLDRVADLANVRLVEIVALLVGRNAGRLQHDVRCVTADAVDVRECDLDALVAWEVDACDASHDLTLPLLVLGLDADNANDALPLDELALRANRFDGCSDFHTYALVRTQGPCSVTAIVCSKCADIERSLVTAVHSSSSTSTSGAPAFTMGSTAMTRPDFMRLPSLGLPKFGTCGSSCIWRPVPWPTNCLTTENPRDSARLWMALPRSPSRTSTRHRAMAASSESRQGSTSRRLSGS